MKVEAVIHTQEGNKTINIPFNQPFNCLIQASAMDPVRDDKGNLVDDPNLKRMMIEGTEVWMGEAVVTWERVKYPGSPVEWDELVFRRGTERIGGHSLDKPSGLPSVWVWDDPNAIRGKLWKTTINVDPEGK